MGWTGQHRDKGQSHDDFFAKELNADIEILASAAVKGAWYAAVRQEGDDKVWALVIAFQWAHRDYFNFTYKDMDENMGPVDDCAPAKVLSLLTPTDHEWANEWRERCRANLARRAMASKVTKGTTVRFSKPIAFGNGDEVDTLTFDSRNTFRHPQRSTRYNIPGWRDRNFELV